MARSTQIGPSPPTKQPTLPPASTVPTTPPPHLPPPPDALPFGASVRLSNSFGRGRVFLCRHGVSTPTASADGPGTSPRLVEAVPLLPPDPPTSPGTLHVAACWLFQCISQHSVYALVSTRRPRTIALLGSVLALACPERTTRARTASSCRLRTSPRSCTPAASAAAAAATQLR